VLRPGFFEAKYGRGLERDYDGHETIERVEFVEAFGHFNEVGYHFAAFFDALAVENFFLRPKCCLLGKKIEI